MKLIRFIKKKKSFFSFSSKTKESARLTGKHVHHGEKRPPAGNTYVVMQRKFPAVLHENNN